MREVLVINTGPLITLARIDLLGAAKRHGLLTALAPVLARAAREGVHYHPHLVTRVLTAVGEAP